MDAYEQLLWLNDTFSMPIPHALPGHLLNCQNLATADHASEVARVADLLLKAMKV